MILGGVDPLDAVPAMREYECPECGGPLKHQAVQQSSLPLSVDGSERGAGRYAVYACENHANFGRGRDEDPEDKCYETVTVYESGFVSVGGEVEDRTDTLQDFLDNRADDDVTVEDVHERLRL